MADQVLEEQTGNLGPTHSLYQTFSARWRMLREVYEGSGKFLTGEYLRAHPREWIDHSVDSVESEVQYWTDTAGELQSRTVTVARKRPNPAPKVPGPKLKTRRAIARYENIAAKILHQKRAALFRQPALRQVGDRKAESTKRHPLTEWWDHVDGADMKMDAFWQDAWSLAGVEGKSYVLMDKPKSAQPIRSKAEQPAPYLVLFAQSDAVDWNTDSQGRLTEIVFREAVPTGSIEKGTRPALQFQRRIVTATSYRIETVTESGRTVKNGRALPHGFGRLPVVELYGNRSEITPVIGFSLLGDPMLYIDLYNLISEVREIERAQTFGQLSVALGTGDQRTDIEEAKRMLGQQSGVESVLFSPNGATFISPDTGNLAEYQKDREALERKIYRLNDIPWESDSKDAEAEGSLEKKREDFYQALAGYADELERADYEVAELWFRAEYGDSWQKEYENADVDIRWPDYFEPVTLERLAEQMKLITGLQLPHEVVKEFQKEVIKRVLVSATPEKLGELYDLIDKADDPADVEQERAKEQLEMKLATRVARPTVN